MKPYLSPANLVNSRLKKRTKKNEAREGLLSRKLKSTLDDPLSLAVYMYITHIQGCSTRSFTLLLGRDSIYTRGSARARRMESKRARNGD